MTFLKVRTKLYVELIYLTPNFLTEYPGYDQLRQIILAGSLYEQLKEEGKVTSNDTSKARKTIPEST